jgi:hypothetical protein
MVCWILVTWQTCNGMIIIIQWGETWHSNLIKILKSSFFIIIIIIFFFYE